MINTSNGDVGIFSTRHKQTNALNIITGCPGIQHYPADWSGHIATCERRRPGTGSRVKKKKLAKASEPTSQ
ncbi:hypothetical protein OkiPb00193_12010 [Escherichia coli]